MESNEFITISETFNIYQLSLIPWIIGGGLSLFISYLSILWNIKIDFWLAYRAVQLYAMYS